MTHDNGKNFPSIKLTFIKPDILLLHVRWLLIEQQNTRQRNYYEKLTVVVVPILPYISQIKKYLSLDFEWQIMETTFMFLLHSICDFLTLNLNSKHAILRYILKPYNEHILVIYLIIYVKLYMKQLCNVGPIYIYLLFIR